MRPNRGLGHRSRRCDGEAGFTLIELLVVIAIIAILAAILFPAYLQAQKKAALVNCVSNQRQIATAARMYVNDWGGQYPPVGSYAGGGSLGSGWTDAPTSWEDLIDPYVKAGQEIYKCPVMRNREAPSYAWNRHLTEAPEALIQYPTTCPVCWDWVVGHHTAPGIPLEWHGSWVYPEEASTLPPHAEMQEAVTRHFNGLVLAFADGHSKFMRPTRWMPYNVSGRFMLSNDGVSLWPPSEYRGIVVSMHCLGEPTLEHR